MPQSSPSKHLKTEFSSQFFPCKSVYFVSQPPPQSFALRTLSFQCYSWGQDARTLRNWTACSVTDREEDPATFYSWINISLVRHTCTALALWTTGSQYELGFNWCRDTSRPAFALRPSQDRAPPSTNHLLAHRQPLSLAILSIASNLLTNTAYSVSMNCLNYLPLAPSWCHLGTSLSNDFMFSFRSLIKVLYSSWTPTNPWRTTLEMQIISHLQLHPEISVSQF